MSARSPVGELRVRATIEAPLDAVDDAGAISRTYTPLATVWANVSPVSAEARFVASRQEQAITHIVRIRWRPDVKSEMRFTIGSRMLRIHSAYDPEERRRLLLCHCEEIGS